MYKDIVFLNFLNVSENTDFVAEDLLEQIHSCDNRVMGYREVIYIPEKKAIACLLGDMSPVSRVDSYFTNMKFFWEKSDPKEITYSVGVFETCIFKSFSPISLLKTSNFGYGYQSTAIVFNNLLNMFAVGLDTGFVHVYKLGGERLDKLKEETALKVHSKRIMSLAFDGLKGHLFSISEDGYLQVIDVNRKQILGCKIMSLLGEQC